MTISETTLNLLMLPKNENKTQNLMTTPRIQRWALFILGGGINTGVTYLIYLGLNIFFTYQIAYLLSYVIGVIFAYWFNSKFVFRVILSWRSFYSYPTVYIIQYFISAIFLEGFIRVFKIKTSFAPLVLAISMIPICYLTNRLFLKKDSDTLSRNINK